MSTTDKIKIGEIIRKEVESRGMKLTYFASMINRSRQNVHNIFNRTTIDTDLLLEISRCLNHDFFAEYSQLLRENSLPEDANLASETGSVNYAKKKDGIHLHIHLDGTGSMTDEEQDKLVEKLRAGLTDLGSTKE